MFSNFFIKLMLISQRVRCDLATEQQQYTIGFGKHRKIAYEEKKILFYHIFSSVLKNESKYKNIRISK